MQYFKNTTQFHIEEPTAITLGKFDGIHRGHELLIEKLMEKKQEGLKSAIFTFDVPPKSLAAPSVNLITTNDERMHRFSKLGIDYLIECPFTEDFMHMEPESFVKMIVDELSVKCIVCGTDFHFGYRRAGDYNTLLSLQEKLGYEAIVIPKIKEDDRDISSTFVREEIKLGNIEKANHLLGYRYFLTAPVMHGNRIGQTIGIPTINQLPDRAKLLPPNGVYVTEVYVGDYSYPGVTNVGCKPTIGDDYPIGVETHILDFSQEIYDEIVTIEFLHRVREEHRFINVEELKTQMQNDIAYARQYFFS
jgi:riboflavin kinase/FMN adenylyltransferase